MSNKQHTIKFQPHTPEVPFFAIDTKTTMLFFLFLFLVALLLGTQKDALAHTLQQLCGQMHHKPLQIDLSKCIINESWWSFTFVFMAFHF